MLIIYTCGTVDDEDNTTYSFRITESTGTVYEEFKECNAFSNDDAELYAVYRSLYYIKNKYPRYFWWWDNSIMFRTSSSYITRIFSFSVWMRMIFYKTSLLGKWRSDDWETDNDQVNVNVAKKCDSLLRSLVIVGYDFIFDSMTFPKRIKTKNALENLEENIQRDIDAKNRILDRTRALTHRSQEFDF